MRILLAEDEKQLSNALVTLLTRNNYSVDAVYDGEDALCFLDSGIYDCAILDVMMPKLDGISVLREIRRRRNNVPVLILTAKSGVDDRITGLDSGADDYLTKPFSVKELLARIRAITRRKGEAGDNKLYFGDLVLDRTAYTLSAGGEMVRLANKEYQIMEMFMANKGQVISTERFMEKIWGYDTDTEMSVVWVYISYLRKKLAAIKSKVTIEGLRNSGYVLECKEV